MHLSFVHPIMAVCVPIVTILAVRAVAGSVGAVNPASG